MNRYSIYAPTAYPEAYIAGIIILTVLGVILFHLRRSPGAIQLCLSQAAHVAWLTSCLMFSYSQDLSHKLFWAYCAATLINVPPMLLFEFTTEFFQIRHPLVKPLQYGVRLLLIFCMLLVILDAQQTGWYWQSYTFTGKILTFYWGTGARFTFYAVYLTAIVSIAISFWLALAAKGLRRRQAIALTIRPLFPFAAHALNRLHIFPPFITYMIGMLLSALYATWLLHRWRVYTILPLAHQTVIHTMVDGLLVVDEQGYVVEINQTASALFNSKPGATGMTFSSLAADWPELLRVAGISGEQSLELAQPFPEGVRHFSVALSSMAPKGGQVIGKVFVLKEITEQKQNQARLMEQEKALSTLTERNRLGRELHDSQGQFPGYVKTQTQAIRMLLQRGRPEDAGRQLDQLISAADAAFSDARESITGLSIAAQDWDFFSKLQEWLDRFRAMSGIVVQASLPAEKPQLWLKPEAEVHLLRIIQESFTNVRKHAGASEIRINFNCEGQQLAVTISDNGCGFDQQATDGSGSYGLKNIQQRLEEMGGSCSISSAVGSGTMLTVLMPWQRS